MKNFITAMESFIEDGEQTCHALKLCSDDEETVLEELDHLVLIETVNSNKDSTWTAGENDKFKGMKKSEIKKMMGTVVDPLWTIKTAPRENNFLGVEVPATFDSREAFSSCASVISHIRD